jgi:hypothetical protein
VAEGAGPFDDLPQRAGVGAGGGEELVDLAQAGPGEQGLFVGDPLAPGGQHRVGRLGRGLSDQPGTLGQPAVGGVVLAGVAERAIGPAPPHAGCSRAQGRGVVRGGQLAAQHPLDRQFGQDQVGRDTGEVEHQRLDAELSLPRRGEFAVDRVQVAVMDVGAAPVDLQPRPSVEDAAPATDLRYLAGPAEVAQRLGVEVTPVVDAEVPVAVRPVRPLGPRPAERDRLHSRQVAQTARYEVSEGVVIHRS